MHGKIVDMEIYQFAWPKLNTVLQQILIKGAPVGHSIPIREVRLSAGAGFIVVVCGDIMTMPGYQKYQVLKIFI